MVLFTLLASYYGNGSDCIGYYQNNCIYIILTLFLISIQKGLVTPRQSLLHHPTWRYEWSAKSTNLLYHSCNLLQQKEEHIHTPLFALRLLFSPGGGLTKYTYLVIYNIALSADNNKENFPDRYKKGLYVKAYRKYPIKYKIYPTTLCLLFHLPLICSYSIFALLVMSSNNLSLLPNSWVQIGLLANFSR